MDLSMKLSQQRSNMKQRYKKKPEYLDVVYVADDTQSIKDVFELAEVTSAPINFNSDGVRVITLEGGQEVPVGNVIFKDKKTGKLVTLAQEKLLQAFDLIENGEDAPQPTKRTGGITISNGRGIGGEVEE